MSTIDATIGGASANAYLTLAEADAYAEDELGPEAELWRDPSAAGPARTRALLRATREIDDYLRVSWRRYATTQALAFPRYIDVVSSPPVIPADIRRATYLQAAYLLKNAGAIDRANTRRANNLSQFSEPNHSGTVDDSQMNTISRRVMAILARYPKSGGSISAIRTSVGAIGTRYTW